jgi:hypothetical protein
MEEQSHAYPGGSNPRTTEPLEPSDGGDFLSPEESQGILSSLEIKDRHTIGSDRPDPFENDENFVSPDYESEQGYAPVPTYGIAEELSFDFEESAVVRAGASVPRNSARQGGARDNDASNALLSRMAAELKTIKSELGALKAHFNTRNSEAAVYHSAPAMPMPDSTRKEALPEETIEDLKKLLSYLDRLLESLPEEKIDAFAKSEYFELYRKVFEFFDLA